MIVHPNHHLTRWARIPTNSEELVLITLHLKIEETSGLSGEGSEGVKVLSIQSWHYMGVSLNGGTPKHPKMMIFSRQNQWLLGTTILGNTDIIDINHLKLNKHVDWLTWLVLKVFVESVVHQIVKESLNIQTFVLYSGSTTWLNFNKNTATLRNVDCIPTDLHWVKVKKRILKSHERW